jgi:hypothetical protein
METTTLLKTAGQNFMNNSGITTLVKLSQQNKPQSSNSKNILEVITDNFVDNSGIKTLQDLYFRKQINIIEVEVAKK